MSSHSDVECAVEGDVACKRRSCGFWLRSAGAAGIVTRAGCRAPRGGSQCALSFQRATPRPSAFRRGSSGPAAARSRPDRALSDPDPRRRAQETAPPHEPRRSARSPPLADPAPALPALVGAAPPGRARPRVRARFTALSITIPILIQRVIDEAIVGPHHDRLLPYLGDHRRARHAALRRQLHAPLRNRARRDRRRGAAARDALPRLPHLPARVLRPARDRRGDLARDERHLPRALLHRLGRRPGDPERDDDHRRGDRARRS